MTLPTDRDKAERAKERANEQSTKPFDMVGPLCPACNEPVTYGEPDPNEYISDEAAAGFGVDRFAFEYSPDRIQGSNHDNPWDAVHVVPETVEIAAAPDEESTEELRVHAYKHDYSDEAYQMWKDELDEIEKNERRAETNQGLDDFATDGGVDQSEAAIDRRSGESDMVTFERIGKPDPRFRVEQVGADPDIRYRYEWSDRGEPTPELFERVGHLEVKLVTMLNDLDGEAEAAGDAAHEAIVELRNAMMDQRDLEEDQREQVAMGNLEALPEVDRHVE